MLSIRDLMPLGNQKVTDEEILAVFERTNAPIMSAKDVSAEVNITRQATSRRLNEFVKNGELDRKEVGPAVVYWRPD